MFFSLAALAKEPLDSAAPGADIESAAAISLPRSTRPSLPRTHTSPRFPDAKLSLSFGSSAFSASVPFGPCASSFAGHAGSLSFLASKETRRGWLLDLAASGSIGTPQAARAELPTMKSNALEALGGISRPLVASPSSAVSAGLGLEVRASSIASLDPDDAFLTSWQTAIPGATMHGSFATGRVSFSGSVFAGATPLAGTFAVMDTARVAGERPTGTVGRGAVVAARASASIRTGNRLALSAGITARDAGFVTSEGGWLSERGIEPFLGMGLAW